MKKTARPQQLFFQIITGALSVCVFFSGMLSPTAYARTASDITSMNNAGPWFSSAAEDCAAGVSGTSATPTGTAQTIVLDPGHAPDTDEKVDPDTNIAVLDYENDPEMAQVWSVAQSVAKKLIKDGYSVAFTKKAVNDSTTDLKKRTVTAYSASVDKSGNVQIDPTGVGVSTAALGVSIHSTPAASTANAVFEPNAGTFTSAGKHDAATGNWRITSDGKTKKYYGDLPNAQKLADTDKADGQTMAAARKSALGGTNVQTGAYDAIMGVPRDTTEGSIHSEGTVLISQYFATIPWVYNEQAQEGNGSMTAATQAAYANGLIAGIEDIVPLQAKGTGTTATSGGGTVGSGATSITMDKVDLTNFHPDPAAVADFNKEGLPQIKKFMPDYIKAAQAEGVPQNWEILAGLQWPESGFADSFKSNNLGYTGPYQEGPGELKAYLGDKAYDPPLSSLVTSGGNAIQNDKLTDAQFVTLSQLVYKHWISDALGSDYAKLKSGPIPFNASVTSDNTFWKIMHRWNSGAERYEAFNGYDAKSVPMGQITELGTAFTIPGAATTYYMLKQWEASGGLTTINVGSDPSGCGGNGGAPSDSGAADCTNAQGNEKIICNAKQYDPVSYSESSAGNHLAVDGGNKLWLKTCPTINASCYLDCSGLVSIAVYDSFGLDKTWVTYTIVSDTTNWKEIGTSELKPGDVVEPNPGHVEIVDHTKGTTIYTFGAHTSKLPQPEQVGPDSYSTSGIWKSFRYVGKGAGT